MLADQTDGGFLDRDRIPERPQPLIERNEKAPLGCHDRGGRIVVPLAGTAVTARDSATIFARDERSFRPRLVPLRGRPRRRLREPAVRGVARDAAGTRTAAVQ